MPRVQQQVLKDHGRKNIPVRRYPTRELSANTWPDFEKLFGKYGGVQAGCWCMFYQRTRPLSGLSFKMRAERNHDDKENLVRSGLSHGVLVYDGAEPVGWCEYGLKEELPRFDQGRNYKKLGLETNQGKMWRIACFFVEKSYRRKGVAKVALRAALASIAKRGGGTIEAYPATHMRAVAVWFGSVSMFEREGFEEVARLGRSNLVVRKTI